MGIQDSTNYTGRTGTGLSGMKSHNKNKNGYCRTCKSARCYMTDYIPRYDHIWTWEETYTWLRSEVRTDE